MINFIFRMLFILIVGKAGTSFVLNELNGYGNISQLGIFAIAMFACGWANSLLGIKNDIKRDLKL